jgi:Nucleotidyltransferase domain
MNVAAPHRAVVAGLDGDVLVLLAGRTSAMTGREVASALGQRSHDGVRKCLDRLVLQGIVDRRPAGNALMHSLNREHVGASAVLALAGMRTELWSRIRTAVAGWDPPPAHVSVFGSAARGDGTADSDIDLLVVRADDVDPEDLGWREHVHALGDRVRAWTGNRASIIEQTEGEIRGMAASAEAHPIIEDLRQDSIGLAGIPTHELLRAADAG